MLSVIASASLGFSPQLHIVAPATSVRASAPVMEAPSGRRAALFGLAAVGVAAMPMQANAAATAFWKVRRAP